MKSFFRAIGNVFAAFILFVILAAILQVTSPDFLAALPLVGTLAAVFFLIRPMKTGWLQYRSSALGMLLGAIGSLGVANQSDDTVNTSPEIADNQTIDLVKPATAASVGTPKQETEPVAVNPLADKTKQQVWIMESQDAVRRQLRDPKSAEFQKVFFNAFDGTTPVVCGQVNAKNAYGGYTGYKGFIASGDALVFLETDFGPGEFAKSWNQLCVS